MESHGEGEVDIEFELERLEELASSSRTLDVVGRCSHLLEKFPDEGRLYYRRAHARNRLRDQLAAIEDMTRAQERMPTEPAAAFFCGLWCLETRAFATGVSALARAVELEEPLGSKYYVTSARFLSAFAHASLGEFELAQAALRTLPDDAGFFIGRKLWTLSELRELVVTRRRP